jgi:SAM-dependent methyltransferase
LSPSVFWRSCRKRTTKPNPMSIKPHSPEWYDRLAKLQAGYFYPWQSSLPLFNGEDVFLATLEKLLTPDKVVLEIGCGHGELALKMAGLCRQLIAYDRVPEYIHLAQTAAQQHNIPNVTFICADSSLALNNGQARIPADDQSIDVFYSRRGPLHWMEDARRVARPGAVLLQLNPNMTPPPVWNSQLPELLRLPGFNAPDMEKIVKERLAENAIRLHSCWTFQVQEIFATLEDFYTYLVWGHDPADVPPLAELAPILADIFKAHATPAGLEIPFGRFLWQAVID